MDKVIKKNERIALGSYLAGTPDDLTYDEIIEHLQEGKDHAHLLVWQPFEDYEGADVAEFIEGMKRTLDEAYGDQ